MIDRPLKLVPFWTDPVLRSPYFRQGRPETDHRGAQPSADRLNRRQFY